MQRNYDYIFKVCFLGQAAVGKTALMRRYADDSFQQSMLSTIGVDFRFKSINLDHNFIKLQLWDTAGQQRFRSVIQSYYRDADAIILVYDVKNMQSFQMLQEYWLGIVKKNVKESCKIIVFANKSQMRNGLTQQQLLWCQKQELRYYEVSAKTGEGVVDSINEIVRQLMETRPKIEAQKMVMTLNEYNPPKKKKCCG